MVNYDMVGSRNMIVGLGDSFIGMDTMKSHVSRGSLSVLYLRHL